MSKNPAQQPAPRSPDLLADLLGLTPQHLARLLAENAPKLLTSLDRERVKRTAPVFVCEGERGTVTRSAALTLAEVLGVLAAGVLAQQPAQPQQPAQRGAARSPAALADLLGVSPQQLAQQLAPVTRSEGLGAEGLTFTFDTPKGPQSEHLTAAEVLGVLAGAAFGSAEGEAAPLAECPACKGAGECWAAPYYNPRECPECEGRGVVDMYTPDGPPDCPTCEGGRVLSPDALKRYHLAQSEKAAASTPLKPSHPLTLGELEAAAAGGEK